MSARRIAGQDRSHHCLVLRVGAGQAAQSSELRPTEWRQSPAQCSCKVGDHVVMGARVKRQVEGLIGIGVGVRMINRMAHAGLRRKMDHRRKPMFRKHLIH